MSHEEEPHIVESTVWSSSKKAFLLRFFYWSTLCTNETSAAQKNLSKEEISVSGFIRYPVMPSLVALQQMRNRLHLARLGRKLMKWTAISTGKELRRIAANILDTYRTYEEDVKNAFMLLARARFFFPELNKMTLSDLQKGANVRVTSYTKAIAGVRIKQYVIIEDKKPYVHLGISEGGQSIQEAKDAWLELLKKIIMLTQLRINFLQVDFVDKTAKKKQNVLSKIIIPRILVTIRYILSELEEREREETFRLKRIKQKKIKDKEAANKTTKKDNEMNVCSCFDTNIRESEKEMKEELLKKSSEPISEHTCKDDQYKSAENNKKIEELVLNITNVIKSTEQIKLDLEIPSLDRLLDTCNEIKDKIEHSAHDSLCVSCKKKMLDEVATDNVESLKVPSRTCTSLRSSTPSKEPSSSSAKCTLCMKNLQDVVTTDVEPLKTPAQPCAIRPEPSLSDSIKPACQGTCGLESSSAPSIKPFREESNKSCTVRYHLGEKKLQEEVTTMDEKPLTIPSQSHTTKLVPSLLDSTKPPCQSICESVPFSSPSIKPDCKESIRIIEQPVATYELSPEDHDQIGYFEKKFKEIIRVTRLKNEDGTISEEKQIITIKTERKNPRKNDDCVTSGENGSGGRYGWGGEGSGGAGHRTNSNNNDFSNSSSQNYCQRQTKSEYSNKNNTMGNPKVRKCMSAENQKKATTRDETPGYGTSCCMSTNSSRIILAAEPKKESRLVPDCIKIPVQVPVADGQINSEAISKSCISNVQDKTNATVGMNALWRDAYTSTTDLIVTPTPHILKSKYSSKDNCINDEGIEKKSKDRCCNIKMIPKQAKVSYKDDNEDSRQKVVLKGSLLDALKSTYLPQTTTRFFHEPVDSKQKEKYNCNDIKSILNKISQKPDNRSEKPICPECDKKSNVFDISSSNKPCSSILQKRSGGSYPSQYSCLSHTKYYETPSVESVCVTCQASQQELELQSSSHDNTDQSISSYMSCRSVAIETSGEKSKDSVKVCCKEGRKIERISPKQSHKHNCGITNEFEMSTGKISKEYIEACCKKASLKTLVSPKQSYKHNCGINKEYESSSNENKKKICKKVSEKASVHSEKCSSKAKQSDKSEDTDDEDQNGMTCCKRFKGMDASGLESQSDSKKHTKDVGTLTNRSSRYDVRPAKIHFEDNIRGSCACQSDTQIVKNRYIDWLPIKPIHKCKSMSRQ